MTQVVDPGAQRLPALRSRRWFRSLRAGLAHLAHLLDMDAVKLGLEPLIGVEELAEYLGVPVQSRLLVGRPRSEGRIAPSTRFNYERDIRQLVLPAFRGLTLREIGVARCDALIKGLARRSYSSAKRAKTVLRLAFGLAVRHEVLMRNPIDSVSRLHKPKRTPDALTPAQVNAIRAVIKVWEQTRGGSGPNPDGQLGQVVEVMLGTSAQIGELLAIRRCDVDATTAPPTLRIAGTVVSHRGQPTARQPHPKTDRSNRVFALPSFTWNPRTAPGGRGTSSTWTTATRSSAST